MTEREIRGTLRRHGERSLYLFALTSRLATGERIYRFEIREGYCDEMDASRRLYFFDRAKLANRIEQSGISFFSQRICPVLLLGQRERERERGVGCLPRPVGGKQSGRSQLTFSWLLGKYTPRAVVRVHPCDRCMATCHVRVSCDTTGRVSLPKEPLLRRFYRRAETPVPRPIARQRRETAKPT